MISPGRDPTSKYLKSYLHLFNTKYTLEFIWYDQIILLDSGD
ncbi:3-hydroxyacyl-CoA dehydrogenase [Kluyvera genomosp. 3]|uniref:3-hydroxyacyl-CoA dehydrogenase n=2 Tax=Kluyvera TaxID=579 RepID=A0A248KLE0_9ENTR|nr:3-hydroxyacyl-CoA dehydrogenase [Kluyvera genomosp. 3]PSR45063.1 3-hydroxyacyl-CoA dehydrogenase [Kluyvera genomosp. 2]